MRLRIWCSRSWSLISYQLRTAIELTLESSRLSIDITTLSRWTTVLLWSFPFILSPIPRCTYQSRRTDAASCLAIFVVNYATCDWIILNKIYIRFLIPCTAVNGSDSIDIFVELWRIASLVTISEIPYNKFGYFHLKIGFFLF
jgi:hypothetical protein